MPSGISVPIAVAFAAAISPYSGQSGRQCHFDTGAAARFAPFGRGKSSDRETHTRPELETLKTQPDHGRDAESAPFGFKSQPTRFIQKCECTYVAVSQRLRHPSNSHVPGPHPGDHRLGSPHHRRSSRRRQPAPGVRGRSCGRSVVDRRMSLAIRSQRLRGTQRKALRNKRNTYVCRW
jgi:hypothetical protein